MLRSGADPLPVVQVVDVPMTLAGLRPGQRGEHARRDLGYWPWASPEQVAAGLRTFLPEEQPGPDEHLDRAARGGTVSVVIDLAHNEAGLEALLEIMNGIRHRADRLLLASAPPGTEETTSSSRSGRWLRSAPRWWRLPTRTGTLRGRTIASSGS